MANLELDLDNRCVTRRVDFTVETDEGKEYKGQLQTKKTFKDKGIGYIFTWSNDLTKEEKTKLATLEKEIATRFLKEKI
jgi:hypothetical protein